MSRVATRVTSQLARNTTEAMMTMIASCASVSGGNATRHAVSNGREGGGMTLRRIIATREISNGGMRARRSGSAQRATRGRRGFAAQAQFAGRGSYTPAGPRSTRAQSYGGDPQAQTTVPPSTVSWTPDLANSVTIIGNVGADPEIRHFSSGTCVANVRLAVNGGRKQDMKDGVIEEDKTSWFAVDIWGEEAMRMVEHVSKGRTICVQGQLKTDTWTDKDTGAPRSRVKIVAKNFSFVQSSKAAGNGMGGGGGYQASNGGYAQQQQQAPRQAPQEQMGMPVGASPKESLWRSLAEEPDTWWDNRERKAQPGANPRSPDFKHKETGEALWIESRDTPAWVLETLGTSAAPQQQQQQQQQQQNAGADSDGYYGASNPGAYEPDYNQPYGQQQYAGGYQPLDDGYAPAQPFNPDDPPF